MLLCVLRVLVKRISIVVRVMESVQHRRTRELKYWHAVRKLDPEYHAARLLYFRERRARIIGTETEEERHTRRAAERVRRVRHYEAHRGEAARIKECVQTAEKNTDPEGTGRDGSEDLQKTAANCQGRPTSTPAPAC